MAEGAIPTRSDGRYGSLGERNGAPVPLAERVAELARTPSLLSPLGPVPLRRHCSRGPQSLTVDQRPGTLPFEGSRRP